MNTLITVQRLDGDRQNERRDTAVYEIDGEFYHVVVGTPEHLSIEDIFRRRETDVKTSVDVMAKTVH